MKMNTPAIAIEKPAALRMRRLTSDDASHDIKIIRVALAGVSATYAPQQTPIVPTNTPNQSMQMAYATRAK